MAAVLAASITVSTVAAASPSPSPTPPTGPLTTDQLKQALPTDAELPGYTLASQDITTVTDTPDTLTTGGPACQEFLDATAGLSTTYGTQTQVIRRQSDASAGYGLQITIMSFKDPTAAGKVITDAKDGISKCTNIAGDTSAGTLVGTIGPIQELQNATDRLGYGGSLTVGGVALTVAGLTVQVGSTVTDVELFRPQTNDSKALQDMGAMLGQASDIVIGKLGGHY